MLSTIPFCTEARKFCGIAPPKILSSHTNPSPRLVGATSMTQIPYWPCPPDCLTWRPSARLWPDTVSRYATRGVERRILFREARQPARDLLLVAAGLGGDGEPVRRSR